MLDIDNASTVEVGDNISGSLRPGNTTQFFKIEGTTGEKLLFDSNTSDRFGEIVNSSLVEVGEVDNYTFTGTTGQKIWLDGLSSDFTQITARLVSPTNNRIDLLVVVIELSVPQKNALKEIAVLMKMRE